MNIHKCVINSYLRIVPTLKKRRQRPTRKVANLFVYYRICDQGYPKEKPSYITKENCLRNAVAAFPLNKVHWQVYADNVCDETYLMICKYIPESQVKRVSVGHGAGTFRMVYEDAIKNSPEDFIYFLEDDYLHLPNAYEALLSVANKNFADYMTLYDHPDKYDGSQYLNPFVVTGGEESVIYWCGKHHWKITNSTTMTFGAFVDILRKDKKVFWRWTETKHPYDYQIFWDLRLFSRRRLVSVVPSLSTHGETANLAVGVDWTKLAEF